jgi:hypothetical protein
MGIVPVIAVRVIVTSDACRHHYAAVSTPGRTRQMLLTCSW